jgi:hypothetical protein
MQANYYFTLRKEYIFFTGTIRSIRIPLLSALKNYSHFRIELSGINSEQGLIHYNNHEKFISHYSIIM